MFTTFFSEKYGRARQATDDNTIRRMRFACWIIKATDTHSESAIRSPFPWQQWLSERALILRYSKHIACLLLQFDDNFKIELSVFLFLFKFAVL
jgi:hypothetical protein